MNDPQEHADDGFAYQLEDNAKDSLSHGIEHFLGGNDSSNLKQAIFQVFHAVELFLKARLAKEHRTLIFDEPAKADSPDAHTVSVDVAIARLKTAGVSFEQEDLDRIKRLQRIRNGLEHHQYSGNREETGDLIAVSLKFLEKFLNTNLEMGWEDFLDGSTIIEIEKIVLSYDERLERAIERANDASTCRCEPKDICECIERCPACGEHTVPCPDGTSKNHKQTHCYFCDEPWFINICDKNGCRELSDVEWSDDPENYPNWCQDCQEYYFRD